MLNNLFSSKLPGVVIHLIGIKGTGMTAMAEILSSLGAQISGSDVSEKFYTDQILADLGVSLREGFSADNIPSDTELVLKSAAYGEEHVEVVEARRRSLPVFNYPEALGALSRRSLAVAIAGVHGKTTTTALVGILAQNLNLPARVVVGGAVAGLGNRSTWFGGDRYLIAETCEYRRHFLHFRPRYLLLTSVEEDHQDFYPDYASIRDAFVSFASTLPDGGTFLYCHDNAGAREVAEILQKRRPGILFIPYGESAEGPWRLTYGPVSSGKNSFSLESVNQNFILKVPGRHLALDAAAAVALITILFLDAGHPEIATPSEIARILSSYTGSRRRSEVLGEKCGILFMDDYGHHPTAIKATLKGLKEFYPQRRLVVDFMPHTYSRTAALLEEFSQVFDYADLLILHDIYASAREVFEGNISGWDLHRKTTDRRFSPTMYYPTTEEAFPFLVETLKSGDLFLTLGAGNNDALGRELLKHFERKEENP